jgi:hypothetical protein
MAVHYFLHVTIITVHELEIGLSYDNLTWYSCANPRHIAPEIHLIKIIDEVINLPVTKSLLSVNHSLKSSLTG